MEKGFYHPDRGYWQTTGDVSDDILAAYPEGTVEVDLKPSDLHKMVDGVWVEFSQAEKDKLASDNARYQRDMKLTTEVDPIAGNALRWAALTAAQQQAWADYRQALLDIPQQSGFPHDVVWPTKPEV